MIGVWLVVLFGSGDVGLLEEECHWIQALRVQNRAISCLPSWFLVRHVCLLLNVPSVTLVDS